MGFGAGEVRDGVMSMETDSLDSTVFIFEGPSDPLDDFDPPAAACPSNDGPRPRCPGTEAIPPQPDSDRE